MKPIPISINSNYQTMGKLSQNS